MAAETDDAAETLIKRGKKFAAHFVQGVCSSQTSNEIVIEIFDYVLNPLVPINDWDSIDWCKWLIMGGSPEEFAQTVRKFDNGMLCGLVWTSNFVAYRCRTCGISPCMSLCSECFQKGDHKGHDFNMFRSQAGGACDCGDKSVMRETGFCERHGVHNQKNKPEAPPDLLCVAEVFMPRLLYRLIQHLRESHKSSGNAGLSIAEHFLTFLQSLSEMGAAMRHVMTRAFTNSQEYYALACECSTGSNNLDYRQQNFSHYLEARINVYFETVEPESDEHSIDHVQFLKNSCFLEELLFWTIHFEFPQKLVCLLLNMMPDLAYKEAFTRLFVQNYKHISRILAKSKDSDPLSNRVVHVSVQLFSNEDLSFQMTKNHNLLQIMIKSLHRMMSSIATKSILQNAEKNSHLVVDCSNEIMKEHCYWPLVSDFNNVLTHCGVAFEFLKDTQLIASWFRFLALFQGMNVNQRELKTHVEFESNTYYAAFSAELEASATPMWALISHLRNHDTLEKTEALISICLQTLKNWFATVGFSNEDEINGYQVSFHLPLHRCFTTFLGQAVRQQGASLDDLLPDIDTLKLLMMHPLQAQVGFYEILCNMWVRSGLQIKGQAMTYIQCHFCNSVVDPDLFLLQLCAMRLDPDWFLTTVLKRFHVWEWLSFEPGRNNSFLELDKELPMLEGALSFLATLLTMQTSIGKTEEEITRLEMVSLLCMADRTHSQLMDLLPDKCGEASQSKNFESILSQVADYKAPNFESTGVMMQGTYVPKPEIWEKEYDPIHILLRAVHRREYQTALDRYTHFMTHAKQLPNTKSLWPPFRIPPAVLPVFTDPRRILHCKTMHGLIFTILYRAVNHPDLPDQILSLCIYFLDMAVRFPSSENVQQPKNEGLKSDVGDLSFEEWFPSNATLENVCHVVERVIVSAIQTTMAVRLFDKMEVDETMEEDVEMGPIIEEDFVVVQPAMVAGAETLALPSASTSTQLVPATPSGCVVPVSTSSSTAAELPPEMALVPTAEGPAAILPRRLRMFMDRRQTIMNMHTDRQTLELTDGVQTYHCFCTKQKIELQESIISLLLKLHSKLSERPGSYSCKEPSESRIGDSATFVERLLDQIAVTCSEAIQRTKLKLWPPDDTVPSPKDTLLEKDERRRKARERQQKLMAEFANKQKAFLQKTMEEDCKEQSPEESEEKKEFECVICSQMSASEEDRPIGMVVLLQATSVIGHCYQTPNRALPCNEEDALYFQNEENLAAVVKNKIDLLLRYFEDRHWPMALNIGWEGGVHVQSCGHYLHIDCHKAYIQSLKTQNQQSSRVQSLNVERGEYYCPLCRQLANSVVPLPPGVPRGLVPKPPTQLNALADSVGQLLSEPLSDRDSNLLKKFMGGILEDLTQATYPQFRSACSPNTSTLFLFVCSIIRTNLEMELIQRKVNNEPLKKKSCFVPILNVLSLHVNLLSQTIDKGEKMEYAAKVWSHLAGLEPCNDFSVTLYAAEVPLLLRDPVALLLQIILTLPMNLDKAYFRCVVQILYNFMYTKTLVHITTQLDSSTRNILARDTHKLLYIFESEDEQECAKVSDVRDMLTVILYHMRWSRFYQNDDEIDPKEFLSDCSEKFLEAAVRVHCLHFLQIAALLQSHLYEDEMPLSWNDSRDDIEVYCQYLELWDGEGEFSSSACVRWTSPSTKELISNWCSELFIFTEKSVTTARALLKPLPPVNFPSLLRLPINYDDIFKFYHKRACSVCHNEPKDPSLCLICGTLVCLRENCCRKVAHFEAVLHSVSCGAGTAIYLAVNSSTIIVIRGRRACLWGSVYLDAYGEEDRDLKRGKPLYLSEARYSLLQQQWINHSFDHTNKRWVWHKDNL